MNTDTLANGLKAVFGASSVTTMTHMMTCGSDGTPGGVIDKDNLRTVLGTSYNILESGTDLNDVKGGRDNAGGIVRYYCHNATTAASLSNCPTSQPFYLEVFNVGNGNYYGQRLTVVGSNGHNRIWLRRYHNSAWSAWVPIFGTLSGATSERPSGYFAGVGSVYFDTDLGKPVFAKATSGSTVTWVDATGATV